MVFRPEIIRLIARFGAGFLFLVALLNLYFVLRFFELRRTSFEAEASYQQLLMRRQAYERVLRDFAAQASNDSNILSILQRAKKNASAPAAAGPSLPN